MREKLVIKNSVITFVCQIVDVILAFFVRKLFIVYIGIEMLGVNATFVSLLSTLSLAELGFESAVVFSLYKPMEENNKEKIEDIVAILKRIYFFVAIFIATFGIVTSLLLPYLLKGITLTSEIYAAFLLQVVGSAITYLMAHKRTFLYAQQKAYIRNVIITIFKFIAIMVQIYAICKLESYLIYVLVGVVQNFSTNLAISVYVDKTTNYNFKRKKINEDILKKIIKDVKNIFFSKIAGYVYSSTDNIIISSCIGTVSVGLLGNYTQILYQMKTIIYNVFISAKPIVGRYLSLTKNKEESFRLLQNYTYIRYVISTILFVPGFVLCDCFIGAWIGEEYILSKVVSLLLVADIYIHFLHGPLVDYIAGLGYFELDKKISILGAIINLTTSLILVNLIGLPGVLVGTVVSQSFFWIFRSVVIFKIYFEDIRDKFAKYWITCLKYNLLFLCLCLSCAILFEKIPLNTSYLKFLVGGVLSVGFVGVVILLFFFNTKEHTYLMSLIKNQLKVLKMKKSK